MMGTESVIFSVSSDSARLFYTDPVLIVETETSRLYRISRDGKYYILKTPKTDSDRLREILRREYEMSLKLNHPHVAYIFAYENDTPVGEGILMEYVEGRTLAEFLAESPTRMQRERVWEQLLDAVSYIHKKGLRHNDLKPQNIIITYADDDLKLIDFGLSDDDAHYALKVLGCTPSYASPELLSRESDLDVRSDIFSLGQILCDLLGGRYRGIAAKCTNRKKDKRYRTVDDLRKAINLRKRLPYIIIIAVLSILATVFVSKFVMLKADFETMTKEHIAVSDSLHQIVTKESKLQYFKDSVCLVIDSRLDSLYSEVRLKLDGVKDQVLAIEILYHTTSGRKEIEAFIQSLNVDRIMVSEFMSYYSFEVAKRHNEMIQLISKKPYSIESKYPRKIN